MLIPEWFFKEEEVPIKNKFEKKYNPKRLRYIARENIKTNDKELDGELPKKRIIHNISWMKHETLNIGFKILLDSHNNNHAIFKLSSIPIYSVFGIKTG